MGVAETLGIIFAAFMILGGITLIVWFFVFRQPSTAVTGAPCTKDVDCSQLCKPGEVGCTVFDEYQGEVCGSDGKCASVNCQTNATCNKLPGSTCFGYSPTAGESSCVPLSCTTTDDCVPEGDAKNVDVVCVYNSLIGNGVCVPTKPKGGDCYQINGLFKDADGKCIVCDDSTPCLGGSFCKEGRCFRCGDTTDNLCETDDKKAEAGPWGFCGTVGTGCGGGNISFTCTDKINNEDIVLPKGSLDGNGLCLPTDAECAFSWFNTNGSLTGPANLGGRCTSAAPYCDASGKCVTTPIDGAGVLCGQLSGIPSTGQISDSTGQVTYDLTGICTGRLVAPDVFSSLSDFTSDGGALVSGTRCLGNNVNGGNCTCKTVNPTTDPEKVQCPKGTFCQPFTTSKTKDVTINSQLPGICLISSGTGVFVPNSGNLGYFYANSACIPNQALNGIPTCTTLTVIRAQAQGGPGAFCYSTDQCLYQGKKQGTNSTLGALQCVNNRCVGGLVA
uniref:Transmembrane protein n=1 Tax=Pithovirus LCPAC304 TaxID=2506594 RepID=A0A481Z8H2_9VIRU|nr:MAG: hypothetical protein LCPAC304_05210 [Pithovirus LCPAC304]